MLTVKQAAEILGYQFAHVRRMCSQGKIQGAIKIDTPRGPCWSIPNPPVVIQNKSPSPP